MREPYLGPDTYELEHRDLFFGRKAEGRVVASMIASEPLTILTGASGTGKSSLLRAQIMPTLLSRGWCAIYAHPEGDPLQSLRTELIEQGLPDPELEQAAIARLLAAAEGKLKATSRLSDVKQWFSGLSVSDSLRNDLIASDPSFKLRRYPAVAQLLAGALSLAQVSARYSALAQFGRSKPLVDDASIGELMAALSGPIADGRARLKRLMTADCGSTLELAERIWSGWAQPLDLLGVVLILDQAEELYTSFGSERHGTSTVHDWRLREALFEEARAFARAAVNQPIRLCFSLRPEWYAAVRVSLGAAAPEERRGVYFLSRFGRAGAREAIVEPAAAVGSGIDPKGVEYALDELSRASDLEEIDPFLLAVSLHLAWRFAREKRRRKIGRADLQRVAAGPEGDAASPLASGAMQWLMAGAVETLELGEQYDVFELLNSLFNEDGTRRVVARSDLIHKPLRDAEALGNLLDHLECVGLVRQFQRAGLTLVDVRHERVWIPVSTRINADRSVASRAGVSDEKRSLRPFLNRALSLLMNYDGAHLDAYIAAGLEEDPLPAWTSASLRANYHDVRWDQPAARLLLASLLHSGPPRPNMGFAPPEGEDAPEQPLDWEAWRTMIGDLMAIAGQREDVDIARFQTSTEDRDHIITALHRGARILPESAAELLVKGGSDLTRDARLTLMRGIMSTGQPAEGNAGLERIRGWLAKGLRRDHADF